MSIRQWLYQAFQVPITAVTPPFSNLMRLEIDGRVKDFSRPMWSIDRLNHRTVDYGAVGYRDDCLWQLTYYGINRQDTDSGLNTLSKVIENGLSYEHFYRIPGWRFNWQYPQPDVQITTPGTIPVGAHSVRVSGIDVCGNESAASIPVLVTLTVPSAIRVRVLKAPSIVSLFKSYNIYVDGKLEVAGLIQPVILPYAIAVMPSLLGTGHAPIELQNAVPVRWKWVRVNTYVDSTKEDDETDGLFSGTATMETSVFQEREQPQLEVMQTMGITLNVHPTVTPSVVPTSYNIVSTNKVIVNVSS